MKIISKSTNETVAEILTNRSMTLDEAINIVGEIFPENEDENVLIGTDLFCDWYYYDDLEMIY